MAALLAALAVLVAVSGGFRTTVGGLRISARSPLPILLLALINFATWLSWARRARSIRADLESAWQGIERHSSQLIGCVALMAVIIASIFATRSAAGADASGYVSEAAMLSGGRWFYADALSDVARGQDPYLTSPLGWRPSPSEGTQSPTYPPGLPMLMALPHAVAGISGANLIILASAALAVWATGMLAGGVSGLIAAVLIAFSPAFIYQSIQPMSDVPVTAAWLLCFLFAHRQRSLAAGIACAMAVLIRPNLAPLAMVPLLIAERRLTFAAPVAAAGTVLAIINFFWYGSPLRSGYGSTEELFSLANVAGNVPRYVNWLVATSPIMCLGVFGFWRLRRERPAQALGAFALLVVGAYLVYAVFDDWSYLRFLLPAMAVLAVFTAIELSAWIGRWPASYRAPLLFALTLLVVGHAIFVARSLDTFKLADRLRRVAAVGDYINADIPPAAVIVAGEQSGSMRYYTDRPILRWEAATPEALAEATMTLEQSRRPVYIVLDAWENEPFRAKFSSLPVGALDWSPMLEAGTSHRTRLWKLSDRDRFVRGENLTTIRLP